jgi:hypothetical protein
VLQIELDKPGQPHWLSKRVLRVIMGRARQLRLRIRDRPRRLRLVK